MKGLELAISLAQKIECNIQLVFVQKPNTSFYHKELENAKALAENKAQEVIATYKPMLPATVDLTFKLREGKVHEEINAQAKSVDNPWIITSTYGGSGFENLFMGSHAYKIITSTDVPVISTRRGDVPESFKNIVLPIDISGQSRQKVPKAIAVAEAFGATVHVVKVTTTTVPDLQLKLDVYAEQICKILAKSGIDYKKATKRGKNSTELIIDYSEEVNADLIIIMTEQERSRLPNLLLGSFAHQLVNSTSIPVMSITPEEISRASSFSASGS